MGYWFVNNKFICAFSLFPVLSTMTNSVVSSTTTWGQLARDTAQWFIQQFRTNEISPTEIKAKKQELGSMAFSSFFQESKTEKFQLDADKAEPFIKEYFAVFGFNKDDIDKLAIAAKYVNKGMAESKRFNFVMEEGGQYNLYFVAVLKDAVDGMVYVEVTSSQFKFVLPPDYRGWWIFAKKEYRTLTLEEQKKLQSFFLYESLQRFYQSNSIDVNTLSEEDRKFLDFSSKPEEDETSTDFSSE